MARASIAECLNFKDWAWRKDEQAGIEPSISQPRANRVEYHIQPTRPL